MTPSRASTETVNGVSNGDSFLAAIRSRPSSSQRSGVSDRQISPRPSLAMKLIASGVANCAAIVRSPSFSRSSSSQTTTILPWRMSSIACSIVANGAWLCAACSCACLQQPLDVLGEHVDLDVDACALARPRRGSCAAASRGSARRRSRRSRERADGEADAVDGDRALLDQVARQLAARPRSRARARSPPRAPPRRVPVPSTWPCTTCPPRRSPARSASSRLTRVAGAPAARARSARASRASPARAKLPSLDRRSRSGRRR